MASFFKKVILREIAGVTVWEMTSHLKPLILEAESKFDKHMRLQTGVNPALMMPGNYARTLFDSKHENAVCELIVDPDRKALMTELLCQFRRLRTIYRAKSPKTDYPEEVKLYKMSAVKMGKFLLENYSFVEWPNYLHKVIEHVQDLEASVCSVAKVMSAEIRFSGISESICLERVTSPGDSEMCYNFTGFTVAKFCRNFPV